MTSATLLLRQIHPTFLHNGRPSSQAFRPTPKDEYKLSAYDGDQITAPDAWTHYTGQLGLESSGVMALSVGECNAEGLPSSGDPARFPEHCLIDFSGLTDNVIEKKSKLLKAKALVRDWLHLPTASVA